MTASLGLEADFDAADPSRGGGLARRLGLVALLALPVATLAAGGWLLLARREAPPQPLTLEPVTEAEARGFLRRAVDAGLAGDFDALCDLSGARRNCEVNLEQGGADAPPDQPPTSVDARYVEVGGGVETPGWVLTVKGREGRGLAYTTQVMVFRDEDNALKGINVVWWSGARLILGGDGTEEGDPVE